MKIGKLIIVLLIVFTSISFFVAKSEEVYISDIELYISDIELLTDLGLMKASLMQQSEQPMTRAQAAQIFSGIYEFSAAVPMQFKDVPEEHWAYDYINKVSSLKLMNGDGNGHFQPEANISKKQFITVLIKCLGYEFLAEQYGGYPSGYLIVASQLKELKLPKTFSGEITIGEAARLVTSALSVEIMQQTTSGETFHYNTIEGDTLAYKYMKLVRIEGIVTANSITGIMGIQPTVKNKIKIGDITLKNSKINAEQYIGYNVECYAEEIGGEYEIKAIRAKPDYNDIVIISPDADIEFSRNTYIVRDKDIDKEYKYKMEIGLSVIYNGREYMGYTKSDMENVKGTITIIDNNNDGIYDVAIIEDYENKVIAGISGDIIYFTDGTSLKPDNYKNYKIADDEGDEIGIFEISSGDIASIAISKDNYNMEIRVSSKKVDGKITEIENNGAELIITLGEKKYIVTEACVNKYGKMLAVGVRLEARLDFTGKIATVEIQGKETYFYAYLANFTRINGLDKKVELLLYDSDGLIREIGTADKVVVDGTSYKASDLERVLKTAQILIDRCRKMKSIENIDPVITSEDLNMDDFKFDQIIRYRINSEGLITEIDTAAPLQADAYNRNSLHFSHMTVGKSSLRSNPGVRMLGSKLKYGDDSYIFRVPEDIKNRDEFYMITDRWDLTNGRYFTVEGYYTDSDLTAEVICCYFDETTTFISDSTPLTVVTRVSKVLDDQGDVTIKIYGVRNGEQIEVVGKNADVFKDIEVGDVIRFATKNNKAEICIKQFDYGTQTPILMGDYYGYPFITYGSVYDKDEDVIAIVSDITDNIDLSDIMLFAANMFKITVFDRDTKNAWAGTVSDIVDYKSSQTDYSKVLIMQRDGNPISMVVFR